MYSGDAEAQANARSLSILRTQMLHIKAAARDLRCLIAGQYDGAAGRRTLVHSILATEDSVEGDLRKKITSSTLASLNSMQSRIVILNTAYNVDDIAGCIADTALNVDALGTAGTKNIPDDIRQMADTTQDMILRIDEMLLLLTESGSARPVEPADIVSDIHQMERRVDKAYRAAIVRLRGAALTAKHTSRAVVLLGVADIAHNLEETADTCVKAADAFLIMSAALGS